MPHPTLRRTDYLGGADSAAVFGRNLYRSRLGVWHAKRGMTADIDLSANPHVQRGNWLEPMVESYIREHIDPTINSEANWQKYDANILAERRIPQRAPDAQIMLLDTSRPHPVSGQPYIGGHPDGIGDDVLYEIKCPTTAKLASVVRAGAPAEWTFQVQHYLMLTGLPTGCLVIWNPDDWQPYLIWMHADPELHDIMREEYEEFWTHVVVGTEPTDGSLSQDHHVFVNTDEELAAHLADYKAAYNARYEAEQAQKRIRAQILTAVQDRKVIITPRHTATIRTQRTRGGGETTVLTVSENAERTDE